jgi:hypothetical protein
MNISSLRSSKPSTDLENYKKEVGKIRMARESAKIQKMLEED